jgi:Rad3-related DNA helicase
MEKKDDIQEFEKAEQQLHSFLGDISELSKKKPNDPLNKFKLKFINTTLSKLNTILKDDRPFAGFKQFDPDELPSNSDVVLLLSQYAAAVHRFRVENTTDDADDSVWIVRGKETEIPAGDSKDFRHEPK